jgi:hypothetical protein
LWQEEGELESLPARFRRSVPLYPGTVKDASKWHIIFTNSLADFFHPQGFFRLPAGINERSPDESEGVPERDGAESGQVVWFSCLRFREKRIA